MASYFARSLIIDKFECMAVLFGILYICVVSLCMLFLACVCVCVCVCVHVCELACTCVCMPFYSFVVLNFSVSKQL